jgi:signal transduction histidine kinase
MRIGTRLALYLIAALVPLLVLFAFVDERRSSARHLEELRREGRAVARTLQLALEDHFADRELDDARHLVEQITSYERILGIRMFGPDGRVVYESHTLQDEPFLFAESLEQVLAVHRASESRRDIDGEPALSYILPLTDANGSILGALQLLQLVSYIDEDARASRAAIATLTGIMLVATTAVVFVTGRLAVSRPCEELVRHCRSIGEGDFRSRIAVRSDDELGRLAGDFNAMCDRLENLRDSLSEEQERRRETEAALRNAERLAGFGRLTAGLAHEIGTPLGVIRGRTEGLLRQCGEQDPSRRNLEIILGQIDRMARVVRGLLDFARARAPNQEAADVRVVLERVVEFLEHRMAERGIVLERRIPVELPLALIDTDQIEEVFLNLLINSVEAMPAGGTLGIRVRRARGQVEVEIADSGTGIPAEDLPRVFDPFFTTKDVGSGTGLGLSIAYGIVSRHQGTIEVESSGGGTRVAVRLPAQPTRDAA